MKTTIKSKSRSVEKRFNFSNQSTAQLYEAGLISGKAIAILPKYDQGSEVDRGCVVRD